MVERAVRWDSIYHERGVLALDRWVRLYRGGITYDQMKRYQLNMTAYALRVHISLVRRMRYSVC